MTILENFSVEKPVGSGVERHLLLTGATGMVGARVLGDLLLRNPDLNIACLVRGGSRDRLQAKLEENGVWDRIVPFWQNIVVLEGDITQEKLGMDDVSYSNWSDKAEAVIHLAAVINLGKSAKALKSANTGCIDAILAFAAAGANSHKDIHFLSSYAACALFMNKRKKDKIPESLRLGKYASIGAYGRSKWEAEQMLISGAERLALRVIIHRAPFVAGIQPRNILELIIQLAALTGSIQTWRSGIPVVGVQMLSEAVAAVGGKPLSYLNGVADDSTIISHLTTSDNTGSETFKVQAKQITEAMQQSYGISLVSATEFQIRLKAIEGMSPMVDKLIRGARRTIIPFGLLSAQFLDITNTKTLMEQYDFDLATRGKMDTGCFQPTAAYAMQRLYENVDKERVSEIRARAIAASDGFRKPFIKESAVTDVALGVLKIRQILDRKAISLRN